MRKIDDIGRNCDDAGNVFIVHYSAYQQTLSMWRKTIDKSKSFTILAVLRRNI